MGKREFILPGIRPRLCEGEVSKTSVTDRRSKDDPRDLLREMKTSKEFSQTFEVKFIEYNNKHWLFLRVKGHGYIGKCT